MTVETCSNCGRTIGKLETAHLWNSHVLCDECSARLQPPTVDYSSAVVPVQVHRPTTAPQIGGRSRFSVVRVIGMLLLIFGLPLLCLFFPIGLGMMIIGAVFVIAGD